MGQACTQLKMMLIHLYHVALNSKFDTEQYFCLDFTNGYQSLMCQLLPSWNENSHGVWMMQEVWFYNGSQRKDSAKLLRVLRRAGMFRRCG
ncbi:hypothetical protein Lal_00000077 [Lupinus albus]|nr:hypothetical protein Lal_00000077 [Lupinus albus]